LNITELTLNCAQLTPKHPQIPMRRQMQLMYGPRRERIDLTKYFAGQSIGDDEGSGGFGRIGH
jgi:hypothetical protein